MNNVKKIFADQGGIFCISEEAIAAKLQSIKAFVFDWDGVFNNGLKQGQQGSPFSEIDAMGTNLLRFGYHVHGRPMPVVAILSGGQSEHAQQLGLRECFHTLYQNAKNKTIALEHFLKTYALNPSEIAFVFDDVLDVPVATVCGIRILARRGGSPLFQKYIMDNALADYVTAQVGGAHAVREVCELFMGVLQHYNTVVDHRVRFSSEYRTYLLERQRIDTTVYTLSDDRVTAICKK